MSLGEDKESEIQDHPRVERVISLSEGGLQTSRAHCHTPWWLIIASKKIKRISASKKVREKGPRDTLLGKANGF